jgi:hypothetical protein
MDGDVGCILTLIYIELDFVDLQCFTPSQLKPSRNYTGRHAELGPALSNTKDMDGPTANKFIGSWPPASCNLYQPLDAKQSDIYVDASISADGTVL